MLWSAIIRPKETISIIYTRSTAFRQPSFCRDYGQCLLIRRSDETDTYLRVVGDLCVTTPGDLAGGGDDSKIGNVYLDTTRG